MTISVGVIGTKGGIGKTTLTANLAAYLADVGYRVLIIDADSHASVSKYYELHYVAVNGIKEFLLGENSKELIQSCISKTVFPNLDIVLSNDLSDGVHDYVAIKRPDRAFLVLNKLNQPYIDSNYDFVLIDTHGGVGPIQDAVAFASSMLLAPIKPDKLSATEFIQGTQESVKNLSYAAHMGLSVPPLMALIYAKDRLVNSRLIADEIKAYFHSDDFLKRITSRQSLLETVVPDKKVFKESATLRMPVHCIETGQTGKTDSALKIMENLASELFPEILSSAKKPSFFNNLKSLLPAYNSQGDHS